MTVGFVAISELGRIVTGKTPSTSNPAFFDGEYQFITPSDLDWRNYYCNKTERTVTEEAKNALKNQFVPADSVLVTCIGNTIGKCAMAVNECLTNQQINSIVPANRDSAKFIYYLLINNTDQIRGVGLGGGAATPILNKTSFSNIRLQVPPKRCWSAIGSRLSAYDDLIENNRRRILLLEQTAQLLYKEWFVHLRFPGHEHVKIKDGVPQLWGRKPFADLVDFKEGPGLRNHQYRDQGIPFLNIRTFNDDEIDLSRAKCIDETEVASKYQHFLLDEDDHVVSSSGTLGRVVTIRKCHLPVMLNTSLIRMRPIGAMKKWFLKAYLKYGDFLDQATAMATGAAQLNYGPSHLKSMLVLLPNAQLVELFEDHMGPAYQQIKVLLDSNLHLTKARDLLLPRLMRGELAA